MYQGVLTAQAGDTVVRTPVAFYVEPRSHDLTVRGRPLPGTPTGAAFMRALVVNLDNPDVFAQYVSGEVGNHISLHDLMRQLPDRVPADPSYVVGPAEQAKLARIDQRFHRLDVPGTHTGHNRKGLGPDGFYIAETYVRDVPATRVDYVTPGVPWSEEPVLQGDSPLANSLLTKDPLRTYEPGSQQRNEGFRQPLRPDW
jgi:hypothetical protein